MIELRRAGGDDAGALGRLRAASLAEQGHLDAPAALAFAPRAAAELRRLFAAGSLVAVVLTDDGRIAGSACAVFFDRLPFPDGTRHAELCGVYVEPALRGTGWGGRLVAAALAAIEARGVRKTYLRPNPRSRGLYARLGFVGDTSGTMTWDPGLVHKYASDVYLCES